MSYKFIFDADCGFCTASARWLEKKTKGREIQFIPYQGNPSAMIEAGINQEDCKKAAFLIVFDNNKVSKVFRGAAAINFALRITTGIQAILFKTLGCLYMVPGIRQLEDLCYRKIAENRSFISRFFGGYCEIN